jgi:serine phosphatase RsbU (regulator of sigma subunit)
MAFERDGDDWSIRDLGSKNGTLLNGEHITAPCRLRPGDRITAGHLVVLYDDPLGGIDESVVFVDSGAADVPVSTTVVASLEGSSAEEEPVSKVATAASALDVDIRVKALIHAGRELAGHQPLADLFPLILDLALDAVDAERGVLLTLVGDRLLVRAARGESFHISSAVRDRVLVQRDSLLVRDALKEDAFRQRMSIQEQHIRSMLAVPLQTKDKVIGLIYVDTPNVVREFSPEDLSLLTVMANVAAVRLEHARLSEVEEAERLLARELEQAAEIQRRLLPASPPEVPGLDLAGHNSACRTVGGDYYDFFAYPDGRVALVVADVAGKAMPAALLVSSLQAQVQVLAEDPNDLARLTSRLNRLLATHCPSNRFISLFFCLVNPATGETTYCNAGHNPPLVVRSGERVDRLEGGGPILGILPAAVYEQQHCHLGAGDLLVLYSDGVTEAVNTAEEEFGEERLVNLLIQKRGQPAGDIVEAVNSALAGWSADTPRTDDITLVVARRSAE